jgi:hypothetical protein
MDHQMRKRSAMGARLESADALDVHEALRLDLDRQGVVGGGEQSGLAGQALPQPMKDAQSPLVYVPLVEPGPLRNGILSAIAGMVCICARAVAESNQ